MSEKKSDLRASILACDDSEIRAVTVPEWNNVVVHVRAISGTERDSFEEASLVKKGKTREATLRNIRARLVQLAACHEDGTPLFEPADVEALGKKRAKGLDRIFAVAKELAGLTDEDVEELAKNSQGAPSGASGSS